MIRHKVTFDKGSNLLDLVFMVIKDFEGNNWQKYPVRVAVLPTGGVYMAMFEMVRLAGEWKRGLN